MLDDVYLKKKCDNQIENLARNWAPILYKYTDFDKKDIKKDLLCSVNFECFPSEELPAKNDQYWNTKKVRERLKKIQISKLKPIAYYATAITSSHYFLLYSFYHADDNDHPNDLEGCLVILERHNVSPKIVAMLTVSHYVFNPYVFDNAASVKLNSNLIDDDLGLYEESEFGNNVLIQQTSGKHALYGLTNEVDFFDKMRRQWTKFTSRYGIVYYPGKTASKYDKKYLKKFGGTPHYPTCFYQLVDILDEKNGLFPRYIDAKRHGENVTFTEKGSFHNSDTFTGNANGPWLWKTKGLPGSKGLMWKDPAKLASEFFNFKGRQVSRKYLKRMSQKD